MQGFAFHHIFFALLMLHICNVRLACTSSSWGTKKPVPTLYGTRPLIIAHRGASGTLPEHTIEAYTRSILDGADYIECDITLTMDLVPVCLHENWLDVTTNVASVAEFANRRRNLTIGVDNIDSWFAIDFTLAELKTLRKKQSRAYRDPSFDNRYLIPTLEEYIKVAQSYPRVGIYPELKDPEWLNSLDIMNGTRFEDIVLGVLEKHNYLHSTDLCFIQSFSIESLTHVVSRTHLRLVMLIENDVTDDQLSNWHALGINGIGAWTDLITKSYDGEKKSYKNWINSTDLVARCHAHGFVVHVWTMRNEDMFLAWDFEQDIHLAYDYFMTLGIDGYFTDFSKTMSYYLDHLDNVGGINGAMRPIATLQAIHVVVLFTTITFFRYGCHFA